MGFIVSAPGHAAKNSSGQIASACRTVHLGLYWVDLGGAYTNGMPATTFSHVDRQSDQQHALRSCPFYYSSATDFDNYSLVTIPWSCRGSLLWSISTGLCSCPYTHKRLAVSERLEMALCGYVLWDIWTLLSSKLEADRGVAIGSLSMSTVTVRNMQSLCLNIIAMMLHKDVSSLQMVYDGFKMF